MIANVLEIRDLTLVARIGGEDHEALRDLSLTLAPRRTLGLVGESGAGKTMVGRLLSGLLPPNFRVARGSVLFQGRDLLALAPEARRGLLGKDIAFIPQEPRTSLNPVLTIGQQFGEHLMRLGVTSKSERRRRATEQLAAVRLVDPGSLLGKYPHQLSGGMCQRVLIAMAFAGNPPLIVADEPTTALDVMTQARIMALLAEMKREHETAVIFITHDLRLAAHVCDDMAVLYAGEVVETGPAKAVCGDPRHPYTWSLKESNPPLDGARRHIAGLPDRMPSLTAFRALPGCRFAARCPIADAACAAAWPPLVEIAPRRHIRAAPGCAAGVARLGAKRAPLPETKAGRANGTALLEVRDLTKIFRGQRRLVGASAPPVHAVERVSFALGEGEFLGIVGESGSGKSTVARLILGLETPSTGTIAIAGRDMTGALEAHRAERAKLVQMVFQDPQSALNPRRSVGSTVTQALEAGEKRLGWAERLKQAERLLEQTGLPADAAPRYPSQLSGGQRQRVNIARALCAAPLILVADEIVSGLDVSIQAQILNLLLKLREQRPISVLFISHDLSVVRYLCDRVAVMHKGEVVETGPTETVYCAPQHTYPKALLAAVPPDDPTRPWTPFPTSSAEDAVEAAS